jgi:hypothetical protein
MRKAGCDQMVRQWRLLGGVLLQAMLWSIPTANGPQAAVCASRLASASEAADAVASFRPPRNSTATEHSTRCEASVDQSRNAAKATSTTKERSFPRVLMPEWGQRWAG